MNLNFLHIIGAASGDRRDLFLATLEMNNVPRRDYQAMAGMIFGDIPSFSTVIDTVQQLEAEINS